MGCFGRMHGFFSNVITDYVEETCFRGSPKCPFTFTMIFKNFLLQHTQK